MALVVYDRVLQTGTANTTVSFSLSGTVTGYQSFAVVGNGNTTYYSATDGTNWETGLGTYASSGTVLTRTTVSQSSNSNTAVTFSGTVTVWIDYPSSFTVFQGGVLGTPSSGTLTNCTGLPNGGLLNSSVTLGSTAVSLGTTVATFAGMTLNSPTFVTPVLGTPSSGTLTSCTGLPNAGLVNSSVTLGSTAVSLGTTVATFAGVTLSSPTFVTPVLGTPSSGTLSSCSGYNSNSLSGVTLASTVVTSSLTSVGTIGTGTWSASFGAVSGANLTSLTGANVTGTVASATLAATASALTTGNSYQVGSLGIGTAASGTSGEIRATNNITAYYSDELLKTKVGNIENALDKVKQIETMVYHANDIAVGLGYDASIIEVGVTAQSVQKVQPQVVVPAPIDSRYLTVRYERLVPLLIEAIKELELKVELLKYPKTGL
jgi:hypothetical protein